MRRVTGPPANSARISTTHPRKSERQNSFKARRGRMGEGKAVYNACFIVEVTLNTFP